jgi:hypothetical protein
MSTSRMSVNGLMAYAGSLDGTIELQGEHLEVGGEPEARAKILALVNGREAEIIAQIQEQRRANAALASLVRSMAAANVGGRG